jgi:hypothetical protein
MMEMTMWPFRKNCAPKMPGVVKAPAPTTWRPGDMAECIYDLWESPGMAPPPSAPRLGDKLMVLTVEAARIRGGYALTFAGDPVGWRYSSPYFRKIVATAADRKVTLKAPSPMVDA